VTKADENGLIVHVGLD